MRYDSSQLVIYGYFVAPICQKFWSSCLLVQIDRQDTSKENSNLNHFVVLVVCSLQGRDKAAPGFLVFSACIYLRLLIVVGFGCLRQKF